MNQMDGDQLATIERINQVAFRYFLEKGYEATNLRKISDEVGIKAASIYFYYASKQKLFFDIMEKIYERQVLLVQEMKRQKSGESAKEQMYFMFRCMIDDCTNNSAEYRFQIRYKMFPVEELAEELRLFYNKWQDIEFRMYSTMMEPFIDADTAELQKQKKVMFIQFRGFCSSIICEILLSGMTMNDQLLRIHWEHFFTNTFGKEKENKI